jgi:hypothetical protein
MENSHWMIPLMAFIIVPLSVLAVGIAASIFAEIFG